MMVKPHVKQFLLSFFVIINISIYLYLYFGVLCALQVLFLFIIFTFFSLYFVCLAYSTSIVSFLFIFAVLNLVEFF